MKTKTTTMIVNEKLLEEKFDWFLEMCRCDKNRMPDIQYSEMKKSWMAACGWVITYLTNDLPELVGDNEEMAGQAMSEMTDQVCDFLNMQFKKDIENMGEYGGNIVDISQIKMN